MNAADRVDLLIFLQVAMCLRVLSLFRQTRLLNCPGDQFALPDNWKLPQQLMVVRHAIKFVERRTDRYHSNERKLRGYF